MTVANALTISRLVLMPVFVAAFIADRWALALAVFSFAAFTDLIDGTVARLLKEHSKHGAILDPLADKLLLQGCFSCLFLEGVLPWWFFVPAFTRDAMIVTGIIYLEKSKAGLPYRPLWTSKFATLFQIFTAVLGLIVWRYPDALLWGLELKEWLLGAILAALFLILASWVQYIRLGVGILKANLAGKASKASKASKV